MKKLVRFKLSEEEKVLVNFDNVSHVESYDKTGSTIHFIKKGRFKLISVLENMEEIMDIIDDKKVPNNT